MKNRLEEFNDEALEILERKRDEVIKRRVAYGFESASSYLAYSFLEELKKACEGILCIENLELEFISREKFGCDIVVMAPKLLKEKGASSYIKEIIPSLLLAVSKLPKEEVEFSEARGIYVNIKLPPEYLFKTVLLAVSMSDRYGKLDLGKGHSIAIDYSSPNIAKHLHPGHIRSTIIGEVLSNIYEAAGFTVHRLNYLNDWGGMGYLLEGYSKWKDKIPPSLSKNDDLYFIYKIFRKGEQFSKDELVYNTVTSSDLDELKSFYGSFGSFLEFKEKFMRFKDAAEEKFKRLEKGEDLEFSLWREMREWSLVEFNKFYDLINVHLDYIDPESFYVKRGNDLVTDKLSTGEIVLFSDDLAEREIESSKKLLENGEITEKVFEHSKEEILNDVGAYVVLLSNHRRLVVKKASGATIYATRDLAAIENRISVFNPDKIVYEVGEEQSQYFNDLFEAAKSLKLDENGKVSFVHAAHGLYIDALTGKKLSSREGAEGVFDLIKNTIGYFRKKYEDRTGDDSATALSAEEKDNNAWKIAVGSISFNDIKQEKRHPVYIYKEPEKNIRMFEESGGAYIMYSLARCRSLLKKAGYSSKMPESKLMLTEDELELIKLLTDFPRIIARASSENNPAILAEFLLTLSNRYNHYYEKDRVIGADGRVTFPYKLEIHAAIAVVLKNGLRLCHADPPEVI